MPGVGFRRRVGVAWVGARYGKGRAWGGGRGVGQAVPGVGEEVRGRQCLGWGKR